MTNSVLALSFFTDPETADGAKGWTVDDFMAYMDGHPGQVYGADASWFLKYLVSADTRFIDWDNNACSFDSREFIDLIKLAKRLEDEMAVDTMYTASVVYGSIGYIYAASDMDLRFHGQAVPIGFPGDGEQPTHILVPASKIGMSAAGEHKERAWAFVRSFLEPKQQEAGSYLPIRKDSFDKIAEAAMKSNSVWAGNSGSPLTQADIDLAKQVLNNARYVEENNSEALVNMVLELVDAYLYGDKTAEAVAADIQSRARLYMAERKDEAAQAAAGLLEAPEDTPEPAPSPAPSPTAAPYNSLPEDIEAFHRDRPHTHYLDDTLFPKTVQWPGELLGSYEDNTEYGSLVQETFYDQSDYHGIAAAVTESSFLIDATIFGAEWAPFTVNFDSSVEISAITNRCYGGGYDLYTATLEDLQAGRHLFLNCSEREDGQIWADKIVLETGDYMWAYDNYTLIMTAFFDQMNFAQYRDSASWADGQKKLLPTSALPELSKPEPTQWSGELLESHGDGTGRGDAGLWKYFGHAEYKGYISDLTDGSFGLSMTRKLVPDSATQTMYEEVVDKFTVRFDQDIPVQAVTFKLYGGGYDVYSASLSDLRKGVYLMLNGSMGEDGVYQAEKIVLYTYDFDYAYEHFDEITGGS